MVSLRLAAWRDEVGDVARISGSSRPGVEGPDLGMLAREEEDLLDARARFFMARSSERPAFAGSPGMIWRGGSVYRPVWQKS